MADLWMWLRRGGRSVEVAAVRKEKMYVEFEDDAELCDSQRHPGKKSANTRNGAGKADFVILSEIDDDDEDSCGCSASSDASETKPTWTVEDLAVLVHLLIETAPIWVPLVRRGLEAAKTVGRRAWARFPWRIERVPETPQEALKADVAIVEVMSEVTSAAVETAAADDPRSMSRDEAEQRLLVALVARAISDEQVRVLLNARIEDTESGQRIAIPEFTAQEVEERVTLMLEESPALLDDLLELCRNARTEGLARLQPRPQLDQKQRPAVGE